MSDGTVPLPSASPASTPQPLPPLPTGAQFLKPVYRLQGRVVTGFQRGSKQLGFPTANLDPAAFESVLVNVQRGVYIGWARVDDGPVYATVLSLGTNPHFHTVRETVEAYILHRFDEDFYGCTLTLLIYAFVRPSFAFSSLDELIAWIQNDVAVTEQVMNSDRARRWREDAVFTKSRL